MKTTPVKIESADAWLNQRMGNIFQDKRLVFCLVATLLWGLAAHAYGFLNGNFSHDSLNAFYATAAEDTVKLEVGRYWVPLYRDLVRGYLALPWLIGLLGLFFVGIAAYFVVKLLEADSRPLMALICGIMSTNITFTAQIATYVHEFDCNCLALLLAVLTAWCWRSRQSILGFLLASILLMGALGIYQSYISVTIMLMIGVSVLDLFDGKDTKSVFLQGLRGIGVLLCGGILYFIAGKLIYSAADITAMERASALDVGETESAVAFYWNLIKETYVDFRNHFVHNAYRYRISRLSIAGMIGLVGISGLFAFATEMKRKPGKILLICALILVIPFASHVTFFLARGKDVHDVTTYALWLVWVLFPALMFRLSKRYSFRFPLKHTAALISYVLVFLILSQNVLISNASYMKKEIEAQATLSTMTRVIDRLEQREDYVLGQTPVAFIGAGQVYDSVPGLESVSNIVGLNVNRTITSSEALPYFNQYKAYFEYVLNYPMVFCGDATHRELTLSDQTVQMPAFPAQDCIQMINGVLVVKMG